MTNLLPKFYNIHKLKSEDSIAAVFKLSKNNYCNRLLLIQVNGAGVITNVSNTAAVYFGKKYTKSPIITCNLNEVNLMY